MLADMQETSSIENSFMKKSYRINYHGSSGDFKQFLNQDKTDNLAKNKALIVSLGNPTRSKPSLKDPIELIQRTTRQSTYFSMDGKSPSEKSPPAQGSRFQQTAALKSPKHNTTTMPIQTLGGIPMPTVNSTDNLPTVQSPFKRQARRPVQASQSPISFARRGHPELQDSRTNLAKLSRIAMTASRFKDSLLQQDTDRSSKSIARTSKNRQTQSPEDCKQSFDLETVLKKARRQSDMAGYSISKIDSLTDQISSINLIMNENKSIADMLKLVLKDHRVFSQSERLDILQKYSPLQNVKFGDFDLEEVLGDKEQLQLMLRNKLAKIEKDLNKIKLVNNRSQVQLNAQGCLTNKIRLKISQKHAKEREESFKSAVNGKTVIISQSIMSIFKGYEKSLNCQQVLKIKAWKAKKEGYESRKVKEAAADLKRSEVGSPTKSKTKLMDLNRLIESQTKLK